MRRNLGLCSYLTDGMRCGRPAVRWFYLPNSCVQIYVRTRCELHPMKRQLEEVSREEAEVIVVMRS